MSETEAIVLKLKRIEGQVRGLQRMVLADLDCESVLTQILAIKAALDGVKKDLAASHAETWFDTLGPDQVKKQMARAICLLTRG